MHEHIGRKNIVMTLVCVGIFLPNSLELVFLSFAFLLSIFSKGKNFSFPRSLIISLFVLFLSSFVLIQINGYEYEKLIQQIVVISIFSIFYYFVFQYLFFDIKKLFRRYQRIAYYVALLGLIQGVVFFFIRNDIFIFASGSYTEIFPGIIRIHSILGEPGPLAGLLLPLLVSSLFKFTVLKRYQLLIVWVVFTLTISSGGYFIIILFILYWLFAVVIKKKYGILVFVFISIALIMNLNTILETKLLDRFINTLEDTTVGAEKESFEKLTDNASSYATLSNLYVATNAPSRIFGTGLGTHEQNYLRIYTNTSYVYYGLNKEDAYSIYIRLLSEFGFVGIFLLFVFLVRNVNVHSIINLSSFAYILMILIRGGNYVEYGFVFFVFLFYFSNKKSVYAKISRKNS